MSAFGGGYDGGEGYQFGRQSDRGYDRRGYQSGGQYRGGAPSHGAAREELDHDQLCHRMQMANRRMEESSASSLRTLHDTMRLGQDTAVELDRQSEALDRTERRLDEIQLDIDQSKRHMRNIKSPFGGVANYFARRKKLSDITDPKLPKEAAQAQAQAQKRGSSKGPDTLPPPSMAGLKGTGNRVVDDNLDEMGRMLHQLKGQGELIGEQLDESSAQIERLKYKVDHTDVKIKGLNKDIRRQL